MKVIITFTFCCDNVRKSKFMSLEKPGKLGIFSPTLWPPYKGHKTVLWILSGLNSRLSLLASGPMPRLRGSRPRLSGSH